MGAAVICSLCLLTSGCARIEYRPYMYIDDGVFLYEGKVWDHGEVRARTPTDKQALQFICDHNGVDLVKGELAYYEGSLYSLSNYREYLINCGYVEEHTTRTRDLLDTTLSNGNDRVRLIYQQSGRIRILFENQPAPAHIILEGVR